MAKSHTSNRASGVSTLQAFFALHRITRFGKKPTPRRGILLEKLNLSAEQEIPCPFQKLNIHYCNSKRIRNVKILVFLCLTYKCILG